MKRLFITIATLIGFATLATANDIKADHRAAERIEKAFTRYNTSLTLEEELLLETVNEELEISVEDVLSGIQLENEISAIWVYDMEGNVVQAQEGNVDLNLVPVPAELLMTEGTVQYYIITR